MAGTAATTTAKVTAGGVVMSVLAFLATNFDLSPKTTLGAGIIALVSYIVGAIVHRNPVKPQG